MTQVLFSLSGVLLFSLASLASEPSTGFHRFFHEGTEPATLAEGENPDAKQEDFERLIERITEHYAPVFQKKKIRFKVTASWRNPYPNALMGYDPKEKWAELLAFGGLYRYPGVTPDAYVIVLCHEIGHVLAGSPMKNPADKKGNSSEGQADYFATLACAKSIWKDDESGPDVSGLPATASEACDRAYTDTKQAYVCKRSLLAAQQITEVDARRHGSPPPSFETPSKEIAGFGFTEQEYPSFQCRLDTYVAGALCPKHPEGEIRSKKRRGGNCDLRFGDTVGVRPACWYRPSDL